MTCLLFVDDDHNILKINRTYFEGRGFSVYTAENAQMALDLLKNFTIDCAILDILMPNNDGFFLCEKIRERESMPIIFLTSLSQKDFLYRGFEMGGDDYVTKPYDLLELEMRILSIIKRRLSLHSTKQKLSFPPLFIDDSACTVFADKKEIPLTAYEFDILYLLASSPDQVFSPESIYRKVWKLPDLEKVATVQVHIARLRHKLEEACPGHSYLKTIWKKGYKFTRTTEKEEAF